jgi:hypothetical protein
MCRNEAELNAIVAVFEEFFDLEYVDPSTKETAVKALNKVRKKPPTNYHHY